jgi:hypothetical protein
LCNAISFSPPSSTCRADASSAGSDSSDTAPSEVDAEPEATAASARPRMPISRLSASIRPSNPLSLESAPSSSSSASCSRGPARRVPASPRVSAVQPRMPVAMPVAIRAPNATADMVVAADASAPLLLLITSTYPRTEAILSLGFSARAAARRSPAAADYRRRRLRRRWWQILDGTIATATVARAEGAVCDVTQPRAAHAAPIFRRPC